MNRRNVWAVLVCLFLVVQVFVPVTGALEGTTETTAGEVSVDDAVFDDESADTFDELLEGAMEEHGVAGASAAVVEGDEIVHASGYGYADYDTGEAVDPDETLFRVGSVAKLMIWMSVMQGVEDGTLELDDEVQEHLDDFEGAGEGVTLEHLGTHTPGYEDRLEGLFVREYEDAEEWEEKLEREMPTQVRPAGDAISYSNHGTALAGLVVQEANGEPYEEYVEREVFAPLEMERSTFEQPVPEDLGAVSSGHIPTENGFETHDYAVVGVPPAGSMSATAADMGNFMIAKLNEGEFGEQRVLEAESVSEMHDERVSSHSALNGMGYGYIQMDRGGERIVGHTGGTEYFQTLTVLFPEHDTGLFVSFNSPGGGAAIVDVLDAFIEEHLGGDVTGLEDGEESEPLSGIEDRADDYEGEYRATRFVTTYEKLGSLQETITVSVTADGSLETAFLGGGSEQWVEVEPGVFEPGPNNDLLVSGLVIEDDRLYLDAPSPPYERLAWYETATFHLGLFAILGITILSPLLVWPINAYRTRDDGRIRDYFTRPRLAVVGCSLLTLGFVASIVANLAMDPFQIVYGITLPLRLTFALPLVLVAGTLATAALTALEWRSDGTSDRMARAGRVYLTLLVVAFVALLWQLQYWNLVTAAL